MSSKHELSGGCHCGAVRFRFASTLPLEVVTCNCSICRMTGYEHVFVPHEDLEKTLADAALAEYSFNTGTARHWFCRHCGIKSFYQPRSHPGAYSINLRCIDGYPDIDVIRTSFDGSNWEANIDELHDS